MGVKTLGVADGGELAKLGEAAPGGLWLGVPFLATAACVASSCCRMGLRLRAVPRSAPRATKRLCGLDETLLARWPPSTDVETVG